MPSHIYVTTYRASPVRDVNIFSNEQVPLGRPFNQRNPLTRDAIQSSRQFMSAIGRYAQTRFDVSELPQWMRDKNTLQPDICELFYGKISPESFADMIVEHRFMATDLMSCVNKVNIKVVPLMMIAAAYGEAWANGVHPDFKTLHLLPFFNAAGFGPTPYEYGLLGNVMIPFFDRGRIFLSVLSGSTHSYYEIT